MPYKRTRSSSHTDTANSSSTSVGGYRHTDRPARRILFLMVGLWFGAILSIGIALPRSLSAVDQVMMAPAPEAAEAIKELGPIHARMLLRYQISEANRQILWFWGWTQLGLGLLVFGVTLFGTAAGRLAIAFSAGMLLLACLMNFLVIPRMGEISRTLDFSPTVGVAASEDQFQLLHRGFSAFEGVVLILGALLLGVLSRRRRNWSDSGDTRDLGGRALAGDNLD